MRGLYSHLRKYRKILLRNYFLLNVCQILGGVHFVWVHAFAVFAPARIQEKTPGELFLYWFCAWGWPFSWKFKYFEATGTCRASQRTNDFSQTTTQEARRLGSLIMKAPKTFLHNPAWKLQSRSKFQSLSLRTSVSNFGISHKMKVLVRERPGLPRSS